MITKKQVDEALKVISDYEQQLSKIQSVKNYPTQAGCRVKLSEWGRKMQNPHNKIGTIIDYLPWYVNPETDGTVTVKWDGIKKPVDMHVSQVESVK